MQITPVRVGRNVAFKKIYDHIYTDVSNDVRVYLTDIPIINKLDAEGKDVIIVNTKDKTDVVYRERYDVIEEFPWFTADLEIRNRADNKKLKHIHVENHETMGLAGFAMEELEKFSS